MSLDKERSYFIVKFNPIIKENTTDCKKIAKMFRHCINSDKTPKCTQIIEAYNSCMKMKYKNND